MQGRINQNVIQISPWVSNYTPLFWMYAIAYQCINQNFVFVNLC